MIKRIAIVTTILLLTCTFLLASAHAWTCLLIKAEVTGEYKICHYDCCGDYRSDITITVKATERCPVAITKFLKTPLRFEGIEED